MNQLSDDDGTIRPGITIDLPDEWTVIDGEALGSPTLFGDLVGQDVLDDLPADVARSLSASFRVSQLEGLAGGLVFAAGFLEVLDGEGEEGDAVAAASLGVVVRDMEELGGAVPLVAVHAALADAAEHGGLPLFRPIQIVDVGEHAAVKVITLDRFPADAHLPEARLFGVTYYLPVADGDVLVALAFRTPCHWLPDAFEALFDDIASTFGIEQPASA